MGKIFFALFLFANVTTFAQRAQVDSMLNLARHLPDNSDKVMLYSDAGDMLVNLGEIDSAKYYYTVSRDLSEKIDFFYGEYCYAVCITDLLRYEGHYDSALFINKQMLEKALKHADESIICKCYGCIGLCYENKGWWETALENYLTGLAIAEKNDYQYIIGITYDKLQLLYYHIGNYEEGIRYGEMALKLLPGFPIYIGALINLSSNHIGRGNYAEAKFYLQKVDSVLQESPSLYYQAEMELGYTALYAVANEWDKVVEYANIALPRYHTLGFPDRINGLQLTLAENDIYNKRLESAKSTLDSALIISTKYQFLSNIVRCMDLLSKVAIMEGDFATYRQWRNKTDSVQNVITNETQLRIAEELKTKYDTEKKDFQIAALSKERRLFFVLMIAGGVLVVLILAVLLYRNRLQRKQKQLFAAQVALESETAERSRLAKDLHDGLGGMLSLVKLNLNDMKGLKVMEHSDAEHFSKAIDMLDNSITELRRVAHHIMPESLVRSGLKTSLEDFAAAVPNAEFHFFGQESRLETNLEITLYRSAHELVNNVLKHASATHIDIQLVQEPDRISLTVSDNGNGFDTAQTAGGIGLQNIRNRIAVYNGEMHIYSNQKSGTEINIEIPLKN